MKQSCDKTIRIFREDKRTKILTENEEEKVKEDKNEAGEWNEIWGKISACYEDLLYFSKSCREIHDASGCNLVPCIVKCFCDELSLFVQNRGKFYSEKAFFIDLCKQWPLSFNDMFTAIKYKKFCLEYF